MGNLSPEQRAVLLTFQNRQTTSAFERAVVRHLLLLDLFGRHYWLGMGMSTADRAVLIRAFFN